VTLARRRRRNNDRVDRHVIIIAYMREFRGLLLASASVVTALAVLAALLPGH
jgi:hypothetical protein